MKNCPYCHAAIEDNARFCLYCMQELETKAILRPRSAKKGWLLLLLPVLVVAAVLFFVNSTESNKPVAFTHSETAGLATASEEPSSVQPTTSEKAATEQPATSEAETTYTYKKAEHFSIFGQNDPQSDIVITGVQTAASDGIYRIPATIDGKTVVAVAAWSFSAADVAKTVREVYLPDTLKGIYNGAFTGCSGLEGLYIAGKQIIIESGAFEPVSSRTQSLTVYSSADCENGSGSLLSELYTDAEGYSWEEWNGGTA